MAEEQTKTAPPGADAQPTSSAGTGEQATDEFSAAAPPHPGAAGTGETSFGDAEAPGASDLKQAEEQVSDDAAKFLALAQRTQADFENYRKRMARDLKAAEARGMSRLARELLPALDNLERAVAALEASDARHGMADGIRLVTAELSAALGRTGIENYAAKGERFDPVHHEAVAQHPVEGAEPGTIVEVLQSGYRLNDSILRPARVIVAG
jgi:molecular chaperone GrpE